MFNHFTSRPRRHRRVITQDGEHLGWFDSLKGTRSMAYDTSIDAEVRGSMSSPSDLRGVERMPRQHVQRVLGMRRPAPPRQPLTLRQRVQDGFVAMARDLDGMIKVLSTGWRKLADENEARAARLDARLDAFAARVHGWAAADEGRDLAAAHAAGGTEQVLKLTPVVLAEMDRRRKQVAS